MCVAKPNAALNDRGTFISIRERPRNEMEATELAKAIVNLTGQSGLRSLEDGPYGGSPLLVGEEIWGGALKAATGPNASWPLGEFQIFRCPKQRSNWPRVVFGGLGCLKQKKSICQLRLSIRFANWASTT